MHMCAVLEHSGPIYNNIISFMCSAQIAVLGTSM